MLLRRTPLLIAAILLLCAPVASAEDFEADREAGYLGMSLMWASDALSDVDSEGLFLDDSIGISARTGFRMGRYAAFELEAEWLHDLGSSIHNPWNVTLNVKAFYPMGPDDRIQPFLLAGAGIMSAEIKRGPTFDADTDGAYKVGGGVDFFASRNWVANISATWVAGMADSPGVRYVTVKGGLTYVWR